MDGEDALGHGLVDELGGLRMAVRRAKILAGLDVDAEVEMVGYPGASWRDYLRPRASSQPAAARCRTPLRCCSAGRSAWPWNRVSAR